MRFHIYGGRDAAMAAAPPIDCPADGGEDGSGRQGLPAGDLRGRAERIREYADAIGADNPVHHDPDAARAAGFRDVVAPPMFCVVYRRPAMGAGDPRPRGRDQLRGDGPRRPGVRVGRAGLRRRQDHDRRQAATRSTSSDGMGFYVFESRLRQPGRRRGRARRPGPTSCAVSEGGASGSEVGAAIPELRVTPDST